VSVVEESLERLLAEGEEVMDAGLIYLPFLRNAEAEIASRLRDLAARTSSYPDVDIDKAVAWVQKKYGKDLAASQIDTLKMAISSRVLVITGCRGVGKTNLVNSIMLVLIAQKIKCLLCAPTGRAAKRLGETTGVEAKTIHPHVGVPTGGWIRSRTAASLGLRPARRRRNIEDSYAVFQ